MDKMYFRPEPSKVMWNPFHCITDRDIEKSCKEKMEDLTTDSFYNLIYLRASLKEHGPQMKMKRGPQIIIKCNAHGKWKL